MLKDEPKYWKCSQTMQTLYWRLALCDFEELLAICVNGKCDKIFIRFERFASHKQVVNWARDKNDGESAENDAARKRMCGGWKVQWTIISKYLHGDDVDCLERNFIVRFTIRRQRLQIRFDKKFIHKSDHITPWTWRWKANTIYESHSCGSRQLTSDKNARLKHRISCFRNISLTARANQNLLHHLVRMLIFSPLQTWLSSADPESYLQLTTRDGNSRIQWNDRNLVCGRRDNRNETLPTNRVLKVTLVNQKGFLQWKRCLTLHSPQFAIF